MAGQAGNVSAFNTVWTYDIYRVLIKKKASDAHLVWMGRVTTVVGILLSMATAYLAMQFNTIMDYIQAIFSWVNAPLFATMLLGMFWKRTTSSGAFWGLILGMVTSFTIFLGFKLNFMPAIFVNLVTFNNAPINEISDMSRNLSQAAWAWSVCAISTVVISLFTKPKPDSELVGLVKGFTKIEHEKAITWYRKPEYIALFAIAVFVILNIYFW